MGTFLMININLSSFEDGEVGNLRKYEYFTIFNTFTNEKKYDLTSNCRFYNHTCRSYIFTNTGKFSISRRFYCFWSIREGEDLCLA